MHNNAEEAYLVRVNRIVDERPAYASRVQRERDAPVHGARDS